MQQISIFCTGWMLYLNTSVLWTSKLLGGLKSLIQILKLHFLLLYMKKKSEFFWLLILMLQVLIISFFLNSFIFKKFVKSQPKLVYSFYKIAFKYYYK